MTWSPAEPTELATVTGKPHDRVFTLKLAIFIYARYGGNPGRWRSGISEAAVNGVFNGQWWGSSSNLATFKASSHASGDIVSILMSCMAVQTCLSGGGRYWMAASALRWQCLANDRSMSKWGV
ncbi:hypothetical protein DL93DRAFT_2102260 [Clavulina sp. PMI_390]|nr:hypothetical protein DL93DRAFT_2102260 [Clavulina sp. PMI_390]